MYHTAKATGGAISFYGGKTIHTFTSSGTFTTPASFSETCEYVIIGGGGGGADDLGGGGGAGAWMEGTSAVGNSASFNVNIGAGGDGGDGGVAGSTTAGSSSSVVFPAATVTAPGGGFGGSPPSYPGGTGGSGGGGRGNRSPSVGGTGTGDPFQAHPELHLQTDGVMMVEMLLTQVVEAVAVAQVVSVLMALMALVDMVVLVFNFLEHIEIHYLVLDFLDQVVVDIG